MPRPFRRAIRRSLRKVGLDVGPFNPVNDPEIRRVRFMRHLGIDLVLDVGANAGQYATILRLAGYTGRIVSFEPQREAFADLALRARPDPLWEVRRLALGRSDGDAEINVASASVTSSFLAPSSAVADIPAFTVVRTERVPIARLDSLTPDVLGPSQRPYLKMDVQGFELEILGGASQTLPRIVGAEAEMMLDPLYVGQPFYREILDAFEDAGLRLTAIEPGYTNPTTGEMSFLNASFARTGPLAL
jgi:FkbM family methyltransferase